MTSVVEDPTLVDDSGPESQHSFRGVDFALLAVLALATFLVHPVTEMLRRPFWFDESWVAALTRAPWARVVRLSSSTPLGFLALVRLVPGSGLQRGRLVVLGFSMLTTVAAYACVRVLAWSSILWARCVATAAAVVVMLAPISLRRNDLKQYTCDAFSALVVLALGNWVERRESSWRPLLVLAVSSILVVPFSTTALFVIVGVFVGLVISAMLARRRTALRRVVTTALATGAVLAVYFFVVIRPNLNAKLRAFWASYYLTGSLPHGARLAISQFSSISTHIAVPAWLFVVLCVLGLILLVRMAAFVFACAIPFVWVEVLVAGRTQRYPFLNLRTSYFLLVPTIVLAVLGVVFVLELTRSRVGNYAMVGVAVVTLALFSIGSFGSVRQLGIFNENVRTATLTVAQQVTPRDTIVVSESASYGFTYYWPHGHVVFAKTDNNGQGFRTQLSGYKYIYYAPSNSGFDIGRTMRAAVLRWRHEGPGARLFIVRTHIISAAEQQAWGVAFRLSGLRFPRNSKALLVVNS